MTRETKQVLAVLVATAMFMILNETVLSVALPPIMASFHVTATTAQWLTTGFLLTMAIVVPTTGFLLDRFTTRQVYFGAVGVFLAGTVVAGVAPAFWVLLAGRVLQAAGTSVITPLLMATAMTLVPPRQRGYVIGLIGIVMAVAPAIGPTLAGVVLARFTWHALFLIVVPLVLLVAGFAARVLANVGENRRAPLDVASVVLSALGFGGVVYALSAAGGALAPVVVAGVVGVIALALFVPRQLKLAREDRALLNLRVFAVPAFRVGIVLVIIEFGGFLGSLTVLPIFLQNALAASPMVSGLVVMPGGIVQIIASPLIGKVYDRVGPRPILIPGGALMMAAFGGFFFAARTESIALFAALFAVLALGITMVITPLMTAMLSSLPRQLYGHGSAVLNTLQQLAGAAGIAVLIAVFSGTASAGSLADGAATAFAVSFVLAGVALVLAPLLRVSAGAPAGAVEGAVEGAA